MRYPVIFFVFVLALVVGLSMIFTNYENPADRLNKLMAQEPIDECYDDSMEAWFIEFNNNQQAGVDMDKADKIASSKALNKFDECLADTK